MKYFTLKYFKIGRVSGTGTRSPRIAYWQSAINNSLAPKPNPIPTLPYPNP